MNADAARDALRTLETPQRQGPAAGDDGPPPSTWNRVALEVLVAGGQLGEPPALLERDDGVSLLYGGKTHAISGEPEAGKGWAALCAVRETLARGEHVVYFDLEDTAESIVGRLLALGVPGDAIVERFFYVRPDEPLDERGQEAVDEAVSHGPTLAIIDGVTEALALHGLDLRDNGDIAKWLTMLPRPLAASGAAVVLIDHVVKDREARGRFAIGAQHKLAGIDVAYALEVVEPFGRGREGVAKLIVTKDRPGFVRQHADRGHVADLRLASQSEGRVDLELTAPRGDDSPFRPTVLMERVSLALEQEPGLSKRGIREAVIGKTAAKDLALAVLSKEGYVRPEQDGTATRHYVEHSYRRPDEGDRDPVTRPCPDRDPSHRREDRDPVTPPLQGGTVTGHDQGGALKPPTVTHSGELLP